MTKKILMTIVGTLVVLIMVLTSCTSTPSTTTTTTSNTTKTTTQTTSKTTPATSAVTTTTAVTTATTNNEPQYGGKITVPMLQAPFGFDPYDVSLYTWEYWDLVYEHLGMGDWSVPRDKYSFRYPYVPPEYAKGQLLESWEVADPTTYVLHVRKGVYWQNKPPVNGREFVATDVQFCLNRLLGLGDGFTTPSAIAAQWGSIASIKATDKYTVTLKLNVPNPRLLMGMLLENAFSEIYAPEIVQKYGNLRDWHNAVGTGPFILQDYVTNSSMTLVRNDNYWYFDENHPKNRMPYVNSINLLVIPDKTVVLAALRTAKIDMVGYSLYGPNLTWREKADMAKSNPDLRFYDRWQNGYGMYIHDVQAPFNDIRVRRALQMSINRDELAKTYFGGTIDGTPYGLAGPAMTGCFVPYDQWPQDVKDSYTYNPTAAKQLLKDAGYANGINTTLTIQNTDDQDLALTIANYFKAINVNVTINVLDPSSFLATYYNVQNNGLFWSYSNMVTTPTYLYAISMGVTYSGDPKIFGFYGQGAVAPTQEQYLQTYQQLDQYVLQQCYIIQTLPRLEYGAFWPWLKGYQGELSMGMYNVGPVWSHVWIDQNLKKSKGY